jgi:hypothetical protein
MVVVVDVEHLDGSVVMAQYHDHNGKQRWVEFAYSDIGFDDVPMSACWAQLRQVSSSILAKCHLIFVKLRILRLLHEYGTSKILR